jgi:hypothetical protein
MQISKIKNRINAMIEVRRVLMNKGYFIFTTPHRKYNNNSMDWEKEKI